MKKITIIILLLIYLCSCSLSSMPITIIMYVDANKEDNWLTNGKTDIPVESREEVLKTPIENERITKLNQLLKKEGKDYQIEVRLKPEPQFIISEYNKPMYYNPHYFAETKEILTKASDLGGDIAYLSTDYPILESFTSLDDYMLQENGQKLRKEIPDHLFLTNKIQGKMYSIPNLRAPYVQSVYNFQQDFYDKNKDIIETIKESPIELLEYFRDNYVPEDNEILMNRTLSMEIIIEQVKDYTKISGTPFYIRESDRKVVNPYNENEILELYQLLYEIDFKGLTGRYFTDEELNDFFENGKIAMDIGSSLNEEDNWLLPTENIEDSPYGNKYVYFNDKKPIALSGYGILESSTHKEEAFDFLCELQTNPEISNLFIYGLDIQLDENDKAIIQDETMFFSGRYLGTLGNDMIAYSHKNQKDNKKELMFSADEASNIDLFVPTKFDYSGLYEKIDDVNYAEHSLELTANYDTYEEAIAYLELKNQAIIEAGGEDIIAALQKQVDAHYK